MSDNLRNGGLGDASGGVGPQMFRNGLSRFPSGVTVVTTLDSGGAPQGITISAFCSLSLRPPLVLYCLDLATDHVDAFRDASHWVINVLSDTQSTVSELFAGHRPDRFEAVEHRSAGNGCPLLAECLVNLECDRVDVVAGGDHLILTGRVEQIHIGEGRPLLYYRGAYHTLRELDPAS